MNGRTLVREWKSLFLCLCLAVAVAGCSNGGGSSSSSASEELTTPTVSGVAAAGAPLAGYVSLRDSLGNPDPVLTTLLAEDGSFTFDVTGLVPPFFLKVEGIAGNSSYELHSVVTVAGTANVNPLTEAQVKAATGVDPAALYADPSSSALTNEAMQAALAQAAADLKTMLQPLLDSWQAPLLNPITDVYVADGTGLDKLFDIAQINVVGDEIQVVDNATQTTLAVADVNPTSGGLTTTDTISAEEATQTTVVVSDLDQIKTLLAQWLTQVKTTTAAFANDQITEQQALTAIQAYYVDAQSFGINNGQELDQELIGMLEDVVFFNAIQSISSVGIVGYNDGTGVYTISFVMTLQLYGPAAQYPVPAVAVVKVGDAWKITGNGFYADSMDLANIETIRNVFSEQTSEVTVIDFELDDDQQVFSSATVTGPGLPAGGITFTPNEYDWDLVMDYEAMACTRYEGNTCIHREWNGYELTDEAIAAMPQVSTYTLTFNFEVGGTEVHTIKLTKPLLSSQISDAHFPVVHNPLTLTATWASSNLLGQTLNVEYSTPTAFDPLHVGIGTWLQFNNGDDFDTWVDDVLYGAHRTKAVAVPALPVGDTLNYGEFEIEAVDNLWRNYQTRYNFD